MTTRFDTPPRSVSDEPSSRILVAGSDPARRAAVLDDLSRSLPPTARLGEAAAAWEVLERASSSSVVMLAGDLDDLSAASLMSVLGARHPSLPVIALGLPSRRIAVGRGAVAAAG
jgi:DNA-binding NtrC family response regulator